MINLSATICIYDDCKKQAIYNIKGQKHGVYCSKHKSDDMIDIRHNFCIYDNCKKQATYNDDGHKKGIYCKEHKIENMINVRSQVCVHDGCRRIPIYNIEGQKKGLYCSEHKSSNMINIKNPRCVYEGCKKVSLYNFEDQKIAIYCCKHRSENMINMNVKLCIHECCKKIPNFNYENQKIGLYCKEHKLQNMVDIKNPRCFHDGCVIQPKYNYFGKKNGLYCSKHKLDNMIYIYFEKCKSDWCLTSASRKCEGYCLFCFIHLFPDKKISHNYKTKEKDVANFIKKSFRDLTFISDRPIEDGCSKRRPDLLLDLGYQIIIIEIDENQHTDYDCSCENKRMMILSQDVGHRPIIFIRFNPDNYYNNNEHIQSCWKLSKNGLCVIKKSKKTEWNQRLNRLHDEVNYWLINKTDKIVEVIHLFYDM